MTPAEEARFYAEMDVVSEAVTRLFKNHRFLGHLVKEFSQSLYGGRLLYHDFLKPLGRACLSLMAEVDRRAPPCFRNPFTPLNPEPPTVPRLPEAARARLPLPCDRGRQVRTALFS